MFYLAFLFLITCFVNAPYGKFTNDRFGPRVNGRLGWFVQEIISPLMFHLFCSNSTAYSYFLSILWIGHYLYRSVYYAWIMKMKPTAVAVVLAACAFNVINGSANGQAAGHATQPPWIQLLLGSSLFFTGIYINVTSDMHLKRLRPKNSTEYYIPYQGLYKYVSCANYFGEIVEWLGYAILANNSSAYAFVLCTMANLIPRALATHRWYLAKFSDYPKNRRAVLPFVL
jgi:3-oxo-5-alpha-steroid 4-dehydrogenase 1